MNAIIIYDESFIWVLFNEIPQRSIASPMGSFLSQPHQLVSKILTAIINTNCRGKAIQDIKLPNNEKLSFKSKVYSLASQA